jgi:polyisoprenoid-binding protein YceI
MPMTTRTAVAAALGFTLLAGAAGVASAQGLPPGVFAGEHDYHQAPAGHYTLDPDHTAVVAKISHIGYSFSVFRFDKTSGALTWDPAMPDRSALKVAVDTASIATPVTGFAAELSGEPWLNAKAFPQATFVSTAFHQTDAGHGKVEGDFTLLGKTHPLTFDVTLVGAGKGFMGHPRIGVHAEAAIDPKDYGLSPMLGASIALVVDGEFAEGP